MLHNKVAIVTGASREIGATIAEFLSGAGATVVVAHHAEAELAEQTVERIRVAGGQAMAIDADLSSVQANRDLVAQTVAAYGRLDIFVANAGLTMWGAFLETSEETWDTVNNLNLKGSYFGAQAAARQMVAQGEGGRLILSSSVTGVQSVVNGSAYGITKAALRHMARTLAVELGPQGITVNALGIGATVNERNLRSDPDYEAHWSSVIPTGRAIQPSDVAAAALFLASPAAAMINGITLLIDGGWTATSKLP
jgi:NAD(P)-dependent dehydrogenase (short-subunit alcohol dehydrogenase family)